MTRRDATILTLAGRSLKASENVVQELRSLADSSKTRKVVKKYRQIVLKTKRNFA